MRVPLTIADQLERAALVYPERVGVVDEPDPPGGGLGTLTYGRIAELARRRPRSTSGASEPVSASAS